MWLVVSECEVKTALVLDIYLSIFLYNIYSTPSRYPPSKLCTHHMASLYKRTLARFATKDRPLKSNSQAPNRSMMSKPCISCAALKRRLNARYPCENVRLEMQNKSKDLSSRQDRRDRLRDREQFLFFVDPADDLDAYWGVVVGFWIICEVSVTETTVDKGI